MPQGKLDLYKAHRAGADKYTYFLLAAAGACIAFSIAQTQAATLTPPKLLLGVAVLCWGASFFAGCRHIVEVQNLLQQNYQYLRVISGDHPDFPNDPRLVAGINQMLEAASNKSGRWSTWQFRFLLAGAVFFVVWHILEMTERTPQIWQ